MSESFEFNLHGGDEGVEFVGGLGADGVGGELRVLGGDEGEVWYGGDGTFG